MPQALPCVDVGPRSVQTSMVFLKAKTLKTCRAVNAFLIEISHMDPFPGVAGRGRGKLIKLCAVGQVGHDPLWDVLNF